MKLYYSPSSPFVRKVMVAAHELKVADRIEHVPAAPHPVNRDKSIRVVNPLGQIPTLVTEDGNAVFDSRVICEYLDDLAGGNLFGIGRVRWRILTHAAMGDGLLGAGLLVRYEGVARPEHLRWADWMEGQYGKVTDVLDVLEQRAPDLGKDVDIGTITLACGLGYIDYRYPDRKWRRDRPQATRWYEQFSERPSMKATAPSG